MPISQNWDMCCVKTMQHMLLCGVKAGYARTVRNWYLDFGKKKRKFDMSLPRKHKLPMFLDLNAEAKQKIQQYSKEHLHELSVELVPLVEWSGSEIVRLGSWVRFPPRGPVCPYW
jgi:hypothetical protein